MAGSASSIQFCILGSVEVLANGVSLAVGTQMERALLADLVLHAPDVVSLDRLADDLWDGEPPARARQTLRVYVSHLRRALREAGADAMLETKPPGYRLNAPADSIDAHRFEHLLAQGRDQLGSGDGDAAARTLQAALGLWRGDALADLADRPFARAAAIRLNEARQQAIEARIEADLMLGRHASLTGELEQLTRDHPLRESVWALRIRALYRSGRQADALAAYRELRERLSGDLGIDPSPDLQRLERAVLEQAPELSPAASVARALPTGVVTFLMTDIESSMSMWEADARAMSRAMARHDAIVAEQVTSRGGTVIGARGEGDSRFCVFPGALDALNAAVGIQRALRAEDWETARPVKVRIAVYTGEADLRGGDYYGTGPNRCARLRDLGHGGQVLVGQTTVDLARANLPKDLSLEQMGAFSLKDLREPERVYQLTHPDLPVSFPALRAPETQGNVPAPLTRLVGREDDRRAVAAMLADHRLVTLTGAAGSGKTRLAIEVAREIRSRFTDGAWFVDLAPIHGDGSVADGLLRSLDAPPDPGASAVDSLNRFLQRKQALLIMDNCEHVLSGVRELLADLLPAAEGVSICATSREPLRLGGERVYRVPPLELPRADAPLEALAASEAVELFCDRATAADMNFVFDANNAPDVARICRRLDGIPLAIELAASRVEVFDTAGLADRIDERLSVLARGHDTGDRHETMLAAIAWSYDLLTESQQIVLRRLAVFVDGFTFESAEQLCADEHLPGEAIADHIGTLLGKSLIEKHRTAPGRFTMLQLVRAFCLEQLAAAGEEERVRSVHLQMVQQMAARALTANRTGDGLKESMAALDSVLGDVFGALDWARARAPEIALTLIDDLRMYLIRRRRHQHTVELLDQIGAAFGEEDLANRARALQLSATILVSLGRPDEGADRAEQALALARASGDVPSIARALYALSVNLARSDLDAADAAGREALAAAEEADDLLTMCDAHRTVGIVAYFRRDQQTAHRHFLEALRLAKASNSVDKQIASRVGLGMLSQGPTEERLKHLRRTLELNRALGDLWSVAGTLNNLGVYFLEAGDRAEARRAFTECLVLARETDYRHQIALALLNVAEVAYVDGNDEETITRAEEGLLYASEMADQNLPAQGLGALGWALVSSGQPVRGAAVLEEALEVARTLNAEMREGRALTGLAAAAVAQKRWSDVPPLIDPVLRQPAMTVQGGLAPALEIVALLAVERGDQERALSLAAAAATRFGTARDAEGVRSLFVEQIEQRLLDGSDDASAAWERGRALTDEDAIALALEVL